MRPWRPQLRSASAARIQASRVPIPSMSQLAIVAANAADVSSSPFNAGGDEELATPPSPPPPPPPRIERRGARPGRIVSDETRSKMSRAKEGRVMPLETRLEISVSRKGTVLSNDTKERMAEVRRRWWASKRKARKLALKRGLSLEPCSSAEAATTTAAATAVAAATRRRKNEFDGGPLSSDDDADDDSDDDEDVDGDPDGDDGFALDPSSSLDLERAVAELSTLRAEVSGWVSAFARGSGGRSPTRADAERSPTIYRKFIRFIALQDFVRSARGGKR